MRSQAPPRTRLAWRRTALAASVVFLLALRYAISGGLTPASVTLGVLAVVNWIALLALAQRRIVATARTPVPAVRRLPAAVAVTTVGYAVLGAAMVALLSR